MPLLVKARSLLRNLLLSRREDVDLDYEVRSHLEMLTEEYLRSGMSLPEAQRAARIELGGIDQVKEQVREERIGNWVHSVISDCRYGLRQLRKNPGFTAAVVLTLVLGIGVNTAIFSVVDWMLFRPLPVQSPEQLTFLAFPQGPNNLDLQFSVRELETIQSHTTNTFSHIAGLVFGSREGGQNTADGLTVNGQTLPFQGVFVSGDFFPLLGIKPHLGRFILPTEGAAADSDPVVVLSYRYWKRRFNGDESVVGKEAQVNGHPVTIIGITPEGFAGLTPIIEMEGYLPLGMLSVQTDHAAELFSDPHWRSLTIFGRLRPELSHAQAEASLGSLGAQIFHDMPRAEARNTLKVVALRPPGIVTGTNPLPKLAALFLTLAGIVLAVCCLNVANLLLVRATARQREMVVRSALGATRGRLIRQLLTESVLLALFGCAGGILTGLWAARTLGSMPTQSDMPFSFDFSFDWRVFAYAFGAALTTGVLMGIVPALRVSRGDLNSMLHAGGRSTTERKSRMRNVLVVVQIGGSLALLIAAGLFARSLMNARRTELGFDPIQVTNFSLDPHEVGYGQEQGLAFYHELLERLRATAGIEAASVITSVPLSDNLFGDDVDVPGLEVLPGQQQPSANYAVVTPGYFKTMRIALLRGRDFSESDDANAPRVAIINEAMAQRFWPKTDPIGRQFIRHSDPKHAIQVVGIAKNIRSEALYGPFLPSFHVPLAQDYASYATLQVRASTSPQSIVTTVVGTIRSLAPTMPVTGVRSMSEAIHGMNGLLLFDLGAALAAALGGLGLLLALIGIYGVLSYAASQRTQEIGIRMALGAHPRHIFQMIGRQGLVIVVAGVLVGVVASLMITPLIGDFLVGVRATDPLTYVTVSAVLAAAALLAAFIPARRATRVDPMVALRHE